MKAQACVTTLSEQLPNYIWCQTQAICSRFLQKACEKLLLLSWTLRPWHMHVCMYQFSKFSNFTAKICVHNSNMFENLTHRSFTQNLFLAACGRKMMLWAAVTWCVNNDHVTVPEWTVGSYSQNLTWISHRDHVLHFLVGRERCTRQSSGVYKEQMMKAVSTNI